MNELEAVTSSLQECLACVFGLEINGLKCVAAIVKNKNKDKTLRQDRVSRVSCLVQVAVLKFRLAVL